MKKRAAAVINGLICVLPAQLMWAYEQKEGALFVPLYKRKRQKTQKTGRAALTEKEYKTIIVMIFV